MLKRILLKQEKLTTQLMEIGSMIKSFNSTKEVDILDLNKDLEAGKWYKHPNNEYPNWLVYYGENKKCYGFRTSGAWDDDSENEWFEYLNKCQMLEATPQEVESALIEEAIKCGHKYEKFEYNLEENALYGYNGRLEEVFVNGKWNEPFDKFAELKEAHKNGAVIEWFNKIESKWDVPTNIILDTTGVYRIKPEEGEDPYLWGNKIVSEPRDVATENDTIKPTHYTCKGIQPIDYIENNNMDFNEGNVIKYVTRYKEKNGLEDLKKAMFYLRRLIDRYGEG